MMANRCASSCNAFPVIRTSAGARNNSSQRWRLPMAKSNDPAPVDPVDEFLKRLNEEKDGKPQMHRYVRELFFGADSCFQRAVRSDRGNEVAADIDGITAK